MSIGLRSVFASMISGFLVVAANGQSAPVAIKPGDRIVFLGDSITQAGAGPKGYVTMVRKEIDQKFGSTQNQKPTEVLGAGISGNKVPDLEKRLQRDVLAKKPTVVVIYIGINDVWHGESDPARGTVPDRFESGLAGIVDRIQASGARVILATPTVIGEKVDGGNKLDKKLDQYADITRALAKTKNTGLCDLRKAFQDHLLKANTTNKESGILTSDRVHLNDAGNRFLADEMLKALGL
jgi:lysophospholipase L1-like esterase